MTHVPTQDDWMAAMKRGDFEGAWAISDRILADRVQRADFDHRLPRHLQPIWDGRPLPDRHVLVRCYHGLGDTIQFIRFIKRLRAVAREVSVWVQPALMPLVANVAGVDRILPLHDGVPALAYDADIEIMELAHALRVTPAMLADDVPYIRPPQRRARVQDDAKLHVGLIWAAGDWDPRRSLPLSDLLPALAVPHVELIVLQRGAARAEAAGLQLPDLGSDDVETFAAALASLDLLISVDTFGAHLAGAMGVPVWLMLHSDCDWRWMSAGRTTPWYPSMRLFRQSAPGDWTSVIAELADALARRLAARNFSHRAAPEQSHPYDVRTL